MLASLAKEDVLSPKNNHLFLEALTSTIYNSRIPQGLRFQVPVAHKTGSKTAVYNDAALVLLPENPYVLVILTRGVPASAEQLIRQISGDLFRYEQQRQQSGQSEHGRQLRLEIAAHENRATRQCKGHNTTSRYK